MHTKTRPHFVTRTYIMGDYYPNVAPRVWSKQIWWNSSKRWMMMQLLNQEVTFVFKKLYKEEKGLSARNQRNDGREQKISCSWFISYTKYWRISTFCSYFWRIPICKKYARSKGLNRQTFQELSLTDANKIQNSQLFSIHLGLWFFSKRILHNSNED